MNSDHQDLYLQKLQGFIFDEDKIVTYSWLSRTLKIDVADAKILLQTFLNDHRGLKPKELGATYIILGILKESKVHTIVLVSEDELSEKKGLFTTPNTILYSIQKAKSIDFNAINMIDIESVTNPMKPILGSIKGSNCVKRNLKEKKPLPEVHRAASTDKSKASHLFIKTEVKKEPHENKTVPKVVEENVSKDNGDSAPKETKESKKEKTTPAKTNSKKKPATQSGNLANLFAKMPSKQDKPKPDETKAKKSSEDEEMEVDDEPPVKNTQKSCKKIDLYDSGTDEEAKQIEESNKKIISPKKAASKKKASTKRSRKDTSSEQQNKRRKRIVERNESDSDDIFGGENDDDSNIVVSDEEQEIKQLPKVLAPKNKKRKYVDKTYTDDDGFIVTEHAVVYESASEEDEEKEQINPQNEKKPMPEKPKETIKKPAQVIKEVKEEDISPPKGAKGKKNGKKVPPANQPTLMSFFKKK